MSQLFFKTAFTGGASGALDSIDVTGASLASGDCCIVSDISTYTSVFVYNATSGVAESAPTVIAPDFDNSQAYAGDGRWLMIINFLSKGLRVYGSSIYLDADSDTYISAATDDKISFVPGGYNTMQIENKVITVGIDSQLVLASGAYIDLDGKYLYLDADKDTYILADSDDVVQMYIGGTDYGDLKPPPTFVTQVDGEPTFSATGIDVDSAIVADSWESIGPTGGGANNTWAALDDVPLAADWIEIRVTIGSADGAAETNLLTRVFARKNGSTSGADGDTAIAQAGAWADADGEAYISNSTQAKIPLSAANLFDLTYTTSFTSNDISIKLIGWGYNSN